MKRLLPTLALLGLTASAQCVDTDQAQAIAASFFQSHRQGPARAQSTVAPVLAYTAETEGTPSFYVFNRSETAQGFVIINADSTTDMPIIGYSETSSFDPDNLPDNFRWWLEQYEGNGVAKAPSRAPQHRADQGPLLRTQWAQEEPFNSAIRDTKGDRYLFVTGCTATSMAQIMKYYEYPTRGTGSNTYTVHYSNGDLSFSANFGATTYDWASMLDVYEKDFEGNPKNYNTTQANAVAKLMFHAGVAEGVAYSSESSGASDRSSAKALIDHFSYDKSMLRAERKYYTDEEWDDIIYSEIAAGRPVMYSGATTKDEGHSFLVHGYRASDGLYAINWGWGGLSDGYFALQGTDALRPNAQGTGGALSGLGFVNNQSINYNIRPNEEGDYTMQVAVGVPPNTSEADAFKFGSDPQLATTLSSVSVDRSKGDQTFYYHYNTYNYGFAPITVRFGAVLRHVVTGQLFPTITFNHTDSDPKYDDNLNIKPNGMMTWTYQGSEPYSRFSTSILPYNGVYEVLPAYTTDKGATFHLTRTLVSQVHPTITITGAKDAVAVPVEFDIDDTTVTVGKSTNITHSPQYTGEIEYTTSNHAIALVDRDGLVRGLAVGQVVITAKAKGDKNYLPTEKSFLIHVTPHTTDHVDINISATELNVGDVAHITHTKDYDGEITYTVNPAGVVSVSPAGTVTALTDGYATIVTHGTRTNDFYDFTKAFDVHVSSAPSLANQLCFSAYPTIGTRDIASSTDFILNMKLLNNFGAVITPAIAYIETTGDEYIYTIKTGYEQLDKDEEKGLSYDLSPMADDFTPGKIYTLNFYLDKDLTRPMNVPSLTYFFAPDTANLTIGDLTHLISGAQTKPEAVRIINTLIRKILKK